MTLAEEHSASEQPESLQKSTKWRLRSGCERDCGVLLSHASLSPNRKRPKCIRNRHLYRFGLAASLHRLSSSSCVQLPSRFVHQWKSTSAKVRRPAKYPAAPACSPG